MEGHRYADDSEPSWYSGGQYSRSTSPDVSGSHQIGNPYDSGIHERPSGAFRLPEQRPADPYAPADTGSHAAQADVRVPVRGPEYPTIKPPEPVVAPAPVSTPVPAPEPVAKPVAEPTALVPPVTPRNPVYQSRRPATSFLVAIVMVVLMIPVLRLLIDATFTGDPSARSIVPSVLLTLGFTLSGIGLFAIAKGGTISREAWLRPPVAYLPAGLILLVAAGLAVA
ncbi:hypothetical protein Ade02nite_07150 [Paractinoplanes deccanensis]|uniref:Uncharacterized protein n=1 Tax=Paractinoplanes deccanensis TaxID=113561 RepID=A0ABQ3XWH8_9ACTN|nr:hypothetical protein [Actinoplanes deccanensis]GID72074.1 hypothetical protein Ade02nite_07150 [Actinoplanes deccanensis]